MRLLIVKFIKLLHPVGNVENVKIILKFQKTKRHVKKSNVMRDREFPKKVFASIAVSLRELKIISHVDLIFATAGKNYWRMVNVKIAQTMRLYQKMGGVV